MFPEAGFTDTLAAHSTVNHSSTFVAFAANPYAAMPSLHALDATIVSVVMATVVRRRWAKVLWLAWAPWVWFAVMATGNHFWLDVAAGVLVARPRRGDRVPPLAVPPHDPGMSVKEAYTAGARAIASRSMTGLARTRVTPNMLTAAGVTLCAVGAVLVYFEYRTEWMFFFGGLAFVVGSVLDILDGALARAGGKQTPFGGFLDSTLDRVGEGLMLGAIALVFMRDGKELALALAIAAIAGSFLVPYARAKAEGLGIKGDVGIGSRAERVIVIAVGLALAPWGVLPVGDRPARADRLDHRPAADPARPPRTARGRLDHQLASDQAVAASSATPASSASTSAAVTPRPMLARTAAGNTTSPPAAASASTASLVPSRCDTSGCAQKSPLRTAIPRRASSAATATRVPAGHLERRHADAVGVVPQPQHPDAVDVRQPVPKLLRQQPLLTRELVEAELGELLARGAERDGAEHVRRPGLEQVRRLHPRDRFERNRLHRTASLQKRRPGRHGVAAHDERARPERRVELVAGNGEKVDVQLPDADRPVRRKLGCVHENRGAGATRRGDEVAERRDFAGHVRCAGDGEEVEVRSRKLRPGGRGERGRGARERQMPHLVRAPREEIGVMLERRAEHPRAGWEHRGDDVDRVRRVPDEDDVVGLWTVEEARDGGARLLVGSRCDAAPRTAATAVDAAVRRHDAEHRVHGDRKRRCRRRVVQVDLAPQLCPRRRAIRARPDEQGLY